MVAAYLYRFHCGTRVYSDLLFDCCTSDPNHCRLYVVFRIKIAEQRNCTYCQMPITDIVCELQFFTKHLSVLLLIFLAFIVKFLSHGFSAILMCKLTKLIVSGS